MGSAVRDGGNWRDCGGDGEVGRVGKGIEGPECVEVIEKLDELRVRRIMEMLEQGEPIPVPRPPLRSSIPALNKEQLDFARCLVDHGRLTDSR